MENTRINHPIRTLPVLAAVVVALSMLLISPHGVRAQPEDAGAQGPANVKPPGSPGLLHKAEREGSVRTIVGLETGFEPEGRLSRSEVARQREGIAHRRSELREDLRGTGYRTVRRFETLPYVALELSPDALEAAERSPHVTSIVEDVAVSPSLAESTPIIQAPQMWSSGYTGAGKTVAVLDTGVDSSHPFLSGKVVEEACYSSEGDCPNGGTSQTGAGSASPCDYSYRCDHGTHVAGIVAGEGSTFSGVAPGADIMAVQVFSEVTGAACGNAGSPCPKTNQSDYIAALERVYQLRNAHDFSSVNMSFGGGEYPSNCDEGLEGVKAAIDNLKSVGVATVISAGNDGYTDALGAPACISSAVSVGGTTDADQVASSSDWGTPYGSNSASFLDLFAPGTSITSSVPGGGFAAKNGTSMAAPHVAGAWALLEHISPTSSPDEILSALQSTGTMVHDDRAVGGATRPRINIADASEVLNPIANDHLANAQLMEGRSALLNDTNVGATRETSEPDHLPQVSASVGTHSVWYKWKAPVSGRVEINTCFSDFDTVLAAYSGGSTYGSLSPVASDNDSCSGSIVSNDSGSKASFDVTQGATYRIAVAGYSNGDGEGMFTLYARYLPPANNDLDDALTVNGSMFSQKGSTVAATRQGGEPDHLPENANTLGEHSVWYAWTAPSSGKVMLDTCASSFDTVLAVYSGGSTFDSLSSVASNDDGDTCPGSIPFNHLGSQVSFNAVQGRTYRIAVNGFWQNSDGWFFLHMSDEAPPRVKSTSPTNNATGVSRSANVRATFTEAMDAGTINTTTFKLKRKGATNSVAATVTYNAQERRAVLNPDANLKAGATYIATVTTGTEDLAGNRLDQKPNTLGNQKKSWSFRVKS